MGVSKTTPLISTLVIICELKSSLLLLLTVNECSNNIYLYSFIQNIVFLICFEQGWLLGNASRGESEHFDQLFWS